MQSSGGQGKSVEHYQEIIHLILCIKQKFCRTVSSAVVKFVHFCARNFKVNAIYNSQCYFHCELWSFEIHISFKFKTQLYYFSIFCICSWRNNDETITWISINYILLVMSYPTWAEELWNIPCYNCKHNIIMSRGLVFFVCTEKCTTF